MESASKLNFIRQQGFREAEEGACPATYPALMFQPRVLGLLVAAGIALQAWPLFAVLAAILCWNVIVPRANPFDALYNRLVARRWGRPELPPARPPRRFAQAVAAFFMAAIAVSLAVGATAVALIWEGLLVLALSALVFGRFCLGSYLWHLIRGRFEFAHRTLPWSR